jgi:ABC-type branched-subunit amino acid transport system ATPase component
MSAPVNAATPAADVPSADLVLSDVTVTFGGINAVDEVSLSTSGGILGLVGPNGAGKSTLANVISGLTRPAAGDVHWRGDRITRWSSRRRTHAGLNRTFQYPTVYPELTIRENILLARRANDLELLRREYDWAGLGPWLDRYPWELPYGVRKLVDFCRVLLRSPTLVVADEPLSGLAEAERDDMIALMSSINEKGVALIVVEHDVPRLSHIADRLVVLNHGSMIADGTPEDALARPAVIEAFLGVATDEAMDESPSGEDWRDRGPAPEEDKEDTGRSLTNLPARARRRVGVEPTVSPDSAMFRVEGLFAGYGDAPVLHDVDIEVRPGETVALLGRNGAGKTTLLRTVAGLIKPTSGQVVWRGEALSSSAAKISRLGIRMAPQASSVFYDMTVRDNLRAGGLGLNPRSVDERIAHVVTLFPILEPLMDRLGAQLSGGQRQALAVARVLVGRPDLLVLDEPTLGLAPVMIRSVMESLTDYVLEDGAAVLLAEQNARAALGFCDRGYVLETGSIAADGTAAELLAGLTEMKALL